MELWNYARNTLGINLFDLLAAATGALMVITGVIHNVLHGTRQEKFNRDLRGKVPEAPEE